MHLIGTYYKNVNPYVNNYIKVFNRKLRKQWKVFDNAVLIKVNLDKDQLKGHGLNVNSKGKEQSTKKTVNIIHDISNEKRLSQLL